MDNTPDINDVKTIKSQIKSLEFVDSGGFKAVYKGEINGIIEVIKIIYLPPEKDEEDNCRIEIIARIKREIESLRLCKTNRLVKLGQLSLELINISGKDYLIYSEEFIEGYTLKEKISKKYKPEWKELRILTICLMEALIELYNKKLIHRDIKPGNIISTNDSSRPFVLLDLGIAYKLEGTGLTAINAGGPPGTLKYVAPELLKPDYKTYLDIRSDIYSSGITIFEYASGKHPICKTGEDQYTTIYRILKQPAEKLETFRNDLPYTFCEIINRCVKKQPALRFQNPIAVLKQLEEIK